MANYGSPGIKHRLVRFLRLRGATQYDSPNQTGDVGAGSVQFVVRARVYAPQVFTDTDELPLQASDAGGSVQLVLSYLPSIQQVFLDTDELPPQGAVERVEEEYWVDPGRQTLPTSRWVGTDNDEHHGSPLGGFRLDEEYWQKPAQLSLQDRRWVFSELDELAIASGAFGLDEEGWGAPGVQRLPEARIVSQDADENHAAPLGGFRLDEDYWLRPCYLPFTVNRQPVVDTDERAPSAVFGLDDEGWWQAAYVRLPRAPLQPVTDTEERWITSFWLDDELWQRPWITPYGVNPESTRAIGIEDDVWVPFVPATGEPYRIVESAQREFSQDAAQREYAMAAGTRPTAFDAEERTVKFPATERPFTMDFDKP